MKDIRSEVGWTQPLKERLKKMSSVSQPYLTARQYAEDSVQGQQYSLTFDARWSYSYILGKHISR